MNPQFPGMPMPGHPHGPQMQQHAQFGQQQHPVQVHQQVPAGPFYVGFEFTPINLGDGKVSWSNSVPLRMPNKTQGELAESVASYGDKWKDTYENKLESGMKRAVDKLLEDHRRDERNPTLEWKFGAIKLIQTKQTAMLIKVTKTTHIRVILKRVLRKQFKSGRRDSFSPMLGPQLHAAGHQQQPRPINPHMPPETINQRPMFGEQQGHPHMQQQFHPQQQMHPQQHPQQHHQQQGPPAPPMHPGQRPAMVHMGQGQNHDIEILSDSDYSDGRGKHGKKGKQRDGSRSPIIHIPSSRKHSKSYSTNSSRLSDFYDSDRFSGRESPNSSISSSPIGLRGNLGRSYSHHNKHDHRRGSKSYRRGSMDSFDEEFIMVDKKPYGSSGSQTNGLIKAWKKGMSLGGLQDPSLRNAHKHLEVLELEEKRRELKHRMDVNETRRQMETQQMQQDLFSPSLRSSNVLHQDFRRPGRHPGRW